jgi:diguanylate cyclase (GGDEF)-like protein
MPPAPLCPNEVERLQALYNLDILDTPPTKVFDSFVKVACGLFDVPMAAVVMVDAERQWFKAAIGSSARETPRDLAFCGYTILQPDEAIWVSDATRDRRFADHPMVVGEPGIRFYAGAALVDQDGHAIGSLCVVDTRPRRPDPAKLAQLRNLATGVMAALNLHAASPRLIDEAGRDPLTGLLNRRAFDAALRALGRQEATLFMLDLDSFKAVNDAIGHVGADAALREVARRLRRVGRRTDRVFRLDGDAFAFLAEGLSDAQAAEAIAAEMQAAFAETFTIDGQAVPLRTSIGVAGIPHQAKSADQLLRMADAALSAAKRDGPGTICLGQAAGGRRRRPREAGLGRLTMKDLLREALLTPRFEQFRLDFQPVVDVEHGCVATQEALVRWTLPGDRHVGPADFVPLAEECGLVSHLDRWVLRQACATAARWPTPWRVSVNISPVTIGLLDVVGLVRDTLDVTGLPANRLVMEVTETAAAPDPERMDRTLEGLRHLGVLPIADDFGAGHASLAFLRRYAFDIVKTDRCFVAGLGSDARAVPVMEALVRLASSLDMLLVAEGVETEEQMMILLRLGVPKVQGFLLARPVPTDRIARVTAQAERKLAQIVKRYRQARGIAASGGGLRTGFVEPDWLRERHPRATPLASPTLASPTLASGPLASGPLASAALASAGSFAD